MTTSTAAPPGPEAKEKTTAASSPSHTLPEVQMVPVAKINESPTNPRRHFHSGPLKELAENIRQHGIQQPVLLCPLKRGKFELVFGARRFRAAQMAGLDQIPAFVREMDEEKVVELQIAENWHREDVHPLDEAMAMQILLQRGYTHERLAKALDLSTKTIQRRLNLLNLVEKARELFFEDVLSISHAQALCAMEPKLQEKVLEDTMKEDWHDRVDGKGKSYAGTVTDLKDAMHKVSADLTGEACWPLDRVGMHDSKGNELPACTLCPHNTKSEGSLFPELEQGARCLEPKCFKQKQQAWVSYQKMVAAEKHGISTDEVVELRSGFSDKKSLGIHDVKVVEKVKACDSVEVGVLAQMDQWERQKKLGQITLFCRKEECPVHRVAAFNTGPSWAERQAELKELIESDTPGNKLPEDDREYIVEQRLQRIVKEKLHAAGELGARDLRGFLFAKFFSGTWWIGNGLELFRDAGAIQGTDERLEEMKEELAKKTAAERYQEMLVWLKRANAAVIAREVRSLLDVDDALLSLVRDGKNCSLLEEYGLDPISIRDQANYPTKKEQ